LHSDPLLFGFFSFLCLFEAFAFFLCSETPVNAPLNVCTVKLSRFVVNNAL